MKEKKATLKQGHKIMIDSRYESLVSNSKLSNGCAHNEDNWVPTGELAAQVGNAGIAPEALNLNR